MPQHLNATSVSTVKAVALITALQSNTTRNSTCDNSSSSHGRVFSDISSNKKHTNHRNHPTENKKKIPIYKISTGRPRNKRSVKSYVKNFRTESGALVVYKENKRGSWFSGMNYNGHVTGPLCMKVKKISLIDENGHMYAQKNIDGKEHYFHGSSFGWTAPGTTATNYIEEIDRKDFTRYSEWENLCFDT